jgi:hypothetical protein
MDTSLLLEVCPERKTGHGESIRKAALSSMARGAHTARAAPVESLERWEEMDAQGRDGAAPARPGTAGAAAEII